MATTNDMVLDCSTRDSVLRAFRSASKTASNPHAQFDAALREYRRAYPDVEVPDARHAVANIIATQETDDRLIR